MYKLNYKSNLISSRVLLYSARTDLHPKNKTVKMRKISYKINNKKGDFMKKTKFTEEQITLALHRAEDGMPVEEVCRKLGIANATFYRWKQKYGGLLPSEVKKLKQLEEENKKLKQLVADLSLDKHMLQEVISKKY